MELLILLVVGMYVGKFIHNGIYALLNNLPFWRYYGNESGLPIMMELLTAGAFLIAGSKLPMGPALICSLFFISLLLLHCGTDLQQQLLFDAVTQSIFLVAIVYNIALALEEAVLEPSIVYRLASRVGPSLYDLLVENFTQGLLGALVGWGIMAALYYLSKGGIGTGDVLLAPALGLYLGLELALVGLLAAFCAGGIVAIGLLLTGADSKKAIAFGPFLCGGSFVALLWGQELLNWYYEFF